jgi:hypothetical protein
LLDRGDFQLVPGFIVFCDPDGKTRTCGASAPWGRIFMVRPLSFGGLIAIRRRWRRLS